MVKTSQIAVARAAMRSDPKEIFNWYLILCTAIWSFSGVAKGFDEGNIASIVVMDVFMARFGLDELSDDQYANTKGWIVSIATAGAVFGCLGCISLTQRWGRRTTMVVGTVVYMAGIFGQTFCAPSLGGLYASRFVAGLGIGVTTVLPSVYISEIAPRSIRGLCTLQYAACQQLGVVFGFFFNYGVTKHHEGTQLQWQLPTALQLIPAVIWGTCVLFCPESPRFLMSQGKTMKAVKTLVAIRRLPESHPYLKEELAGIEAQINHEIESVAGSNVFDLLKETFVDVKNRRRFVLMFLCNLLSQWSGANAITQYSPTIIEYLGITGMEQTFLTTGIYAIVKFTSTLLFSIFIVDFVGRRRSLMTGISLQIITLTFIGAYLGVTNGWTTEQIEASPSAKAASTASIVAIFFHAVAWSIGWFSIPYLLSAEVFPIRIRSLNMSILIAFHWAFYFSCSRAMPSLLAGTERYGAFVLFASICTISLVYVFFALPETAGRSLESMDALFDRPWYTVHHVAYPTVDDLKPELPDDIFDKESQLEKDTGPETREMA